MKTKFHSFEKIICVVQEHEYGVIRVCYESQIGFNWAFTQQEDTLTHILFSQKGFISLLLKLLSLSIPVVSQPDVLPLSPTQRNSPTDNELTSLIMPSGGFYEFFTIS